MATSTRTHVQGAPTAGPTDAPKAKRASKVADQIIKDVIAGGWQVGQILGSEAELLASYQVSRAVFREEVRLVEHQQVARTRRGPGGGLVVTEPTVDAVIDAVVLYLYRAEARLDEVFEARLVLEDIAAGLAPTRLEEHDLATLRAFAADAQPLPPDDPRALHSLVAAMSRNPAVELFVDVLTLVVASRTARFGLPEVSRGLVASCGALFRAPQRVPANLARELLLTGDPIDADRAREAGLVNVVTEPGGAVAAAVALAERICANAPVAVQASLVAVNQWLAAAEEFGWQVTADAVAAIGASEDHREGIAAFLEERPPRWTGR